MGKSRSAVIKEASLQYITCFLIIFQLLKWLIGVTESEMRTSQFPFLCEGFISHRANNAGLDNVFKDGAHLPALLQTEL